MKKSAALMLSLLLAALCTVTFLPVRAEAKTIVVPDDYNSIEAALNYADDGDAILVKTGNYSCTKNQTLTIDKAVTLYGEKPNSTVINIEPPLVPMWLFSYQYMGYSDAIKIQADNVKISGLTLHSSGGRINIEGSYIELRNCIVNSAVSISGNYVWVAGNIFDNPGITITMSGSHHTVSNNILKGVGCSASCCMITKNTVTGHATDGLIAIEGNQNTVYANSITADGGSGIVVRLNANGTVIAQNVIEGCLGVHLEGASNSVVTANTIKNYVGIYLDRGSNNVFCGNHLENNTIGLKMGYDQTDISRQHGEPRAVNNTVYHNNFVGNAQQAVDWNWLSTNYWDKDKEGNYWSNYNGSDWTLDGVGDSPYMLDVAKSYYAESTQGVDQYPLMSPVPVNSNIAELPDEVSLNLDATCKQTNYAMLIVLVAIPIAVVVVGFAYFKKKVRRADLTGAKTPAI